MTQEQGSKTSSVGRPKKVTRDKIVRAALEVMEQAGFAALSMRSLARQLGINHATLYNYIESIEEIEQAALDELMMRIPTPDPAKETPLRQQLIEHMLAVYETQLLFPAFCQAPPGSRTWTLHMKCMMQILDACTDNDEQLEEAAIAYNALISLVATNAERSRLCGNKTPIKPYLEAVAELPRNEFESLLRPAIQKGQFSKNLSSFVYRLDYLIGRLMPHLPALEPELLERIESDFSEARLAVPTNN